MLAQFWCAMKVRLSWWLAASRRSEALGLLYVFGLSVVWSFAFWSWVWAPLSNATVCVALGLALF